MCLPDKPLRFLKELLLSPSSMSARKHGDNITNLGKRQFQDEKVSNYCVMDIDFHLELVTLQDTEKLWFSESTELRECQAMKKVILMFVLTKILLFFFCTSTANDSISQFKSLSVGNTLVSEEGTFELGFFRPGRAADLYLGIWYKSIPVKTVVWVANRAKPVKGNSSVLHINSEGNLQLVNHNGVVAWSANSTKKVQNPIVQLLNSGNLVVRDERDQDPESYLWQSFDYPSDTLLPGMKLGWDLRTGLERRVSAWKNWDDPSPGDFSWGISLEGFPQVMMWKGSKVFYRGGHWNGLGFSGAPELKANPVFKFKFVSNENEVYYTYSLTNESIISRIVMNQSISTRQRYIWIEDAQAWRIYASVPRDNCDSYNICGSNGNCVIGDSPVCQCLSGFKPRFPKHWDMMDWTQGCFLSEEWNCEERRKHGFVKFNQLKAPDTSNSWVNESMSLTECRDKCLENCSCNAYANTDVRGGGKGCLMWFGDLRDIREFSAGGWDLYIRTKILESVFNDSEFTLLSQFYINHEGEKKNYSMKVVAVVLTTAAVVAAILALYQFGKRMKKFRDNNKDEEELELPFFDQAAITKATNGFSINNKLGEGGFGTVYMAWRFWKESRPLDLLDSCMENSSVLSGALRCIHISLLCVQQHPEDRPSMSTVVVMLSSESSLPQPKEPGFLMEKEKIFLGAESSTKHL
ncbi:hypothetical protein V8G54_020599 [Vigna mungo]|uniref:non-specific serine/threonine protein kinase n=1 Tax=Vigna mungo TaxID=3915 RepID=A0AAQ3NFV2_VIGMU